MLKIMLNTNVFCRPYDDLTDDIVKEEAKSAETIFSFAHQAKIEIISSDVLYEEVDLIEDKAKNEAVYYLIKTVEKERASTNERVIELANALNDMVKDYNDCLHIAFAAISRCFCLITCDQELINKKGKIESFLLSKKISLTIITPSEFIANYS